MIDKTRLNQEKFTAEQLLLTVVEAAELLRVSRTTVYALMNAGDLKPVHIGRACRISVAEVRRYVATRDEATKVALATPPTDSLT